MKILATTLPKDDEKVLEAERFSEKDVYAMQLKFKYETRRQSTKTELRSCNNVLAITKVANIAISFSSFLPFLYRYPINLIIYEATCTNLTVYACYSY